MIWQNSQSFPFLSRRSAHKTIHWITCQARVVCLTVWCAARFVMFRLGVTACAVCQEVWRSSKISKLFSSAATVSQSCRRTLGSSGIWRTASTFGQFQPDLFVFYFILVFLVSSLILTPVCFRRAALEWRSTSCDGEGASPGGQQTQIVAWQFWGPPWASKVGLGTKSDPQKQTALAALILNAEKDFVGVKIAEERHYIHSLKEETDQTMSQLNDEITN